MKEPARRKWLKAMYLANLLVAAPLGLATLVAPGTVRMLMGIPPPDPVFYGLAAGAVPLAFGLAGAAGLRAPLRLSPVLALQALYKSLFLFAVVAPLATTGRMPGHAVPLIVIFVFFIAGDLVAVPFRRLLSPAPGVEGPPPGGTARGEGAMGG